MQRFKQKEDTKLENNIIKYFKDSYSEYTINKLRDELIKSTNYKLIKKERGKLFFLRVNRPSKNVEKVSI